MNKPKGKVSKWALLHSIQYSLIFLPVLFLLNISLYFGIYIFITHFIVDTYIPTKLWNKYVRNAICKNKIPENEPPVSIEHVQDQVLHILSLIPLAL